MKILNVFDAVMDGTFEDFKNYYDGEINKINEYTKLNMLCTAVLNDKNKDDKIKIINYIIKEGVDLNYIGKKYKRNALHTIFFNNINSSAEHIYNVVEILLKNGIDVNCTDKYGAIPMQYAISSPKNPTDEMEKIYKVLLKFGSDYKHEDNYNNSCLHYAKQFAWRNGFLDIVKEYENKK